MIHMYVVTQVENNRVQGRRLFKTEQDAMECFRRLMESKWIKAVKYSCVTKEYFDDTYHSQAECMELKEFTIQGVHYQVLPIALY